MYLVLILLFLWFIHAPAWICVALILLACLWFLMLLLAAPRKEDYLVLENPGPVFFWFLGFLSGVKTFLSIPVVLFHVFTDPNWKPPKKK